MPYINLENREIAFKVVYCGPGESGKTTNVLHLHRNLEEPLKGGLVSLQTAGERTLFFDYFPIELGEVSGFQLRLNVYTVPGQLCYAATRRLVLDEADGVVFTVDSAAARLDDNLESYRGLQACLEESGRCSGADAGGASLPIVLQYNKRDLGAVVPLGSLERALELGTMPFHEAVALKGIGVFETVRTISRLVVARLQG